MKNIRYIFKQKANKLLLVSILISFLCPVLVYSYSNFIVSTNDYKSNEMYMGKLLFSTKVNNVTASSITVPSGGHFYDIEITSLNSIKSKYKLTLSSNDSLEYKYAYNTLFPVSGELDEVGGSVVSKTIKIHIKNNSSSGIVVNIGVIGGYIYNSYNAIIAESGYDEITEEKKLTLSEKILSDMPIYNDNVASTYVTSSTGINFGAGNSPTNGHGIYRDYKYGSGNNYYFRGGNYCYKHGNIPVDAVGAFEDNSAESLAQCIAIEGEGLVGPLEGLLGDTYYDCVIYDENEHNVFDAFALCEANGGTWNSTFDRCSVHYSTSECEANGGTYYTYNNNILFAGYYWKILKIDEDGNIKMIFNGTTPESDSTSNIGTSEYNPQKNSNTYVGYMYGNASGSSYNLVHTNTTSSSIKNVVDTWYQNNLITYTDKLANVGFCNDRSIYHGTGFGTTTTMYAPYQRNMRWDYQDNEVAVFTPTFSCANANDTFSLIGGSFGNKKLTYPIAIITQDEAMYAGYSNSCYNKSNYLFMNSESYTMSPRLYFENSYSSVVILSDYCGFNSNNVTTVSGVRPVIAVKSDTVYVSGNGSTTSPYIVQ